MGGLSGYFEERQQEILDRAMIDAALAYWDNNSVRTADNSEEYIERRRLMIAGCRSTYRPHLLAALALMDTGG